MRQLFWLFGFGGFGLALPACAPPTPEEESDATPPARRAGQSDAKAQPKFHSVGRYRGKVADTGSDWVELAAGWECKLDKNAKQDGSDNSKSRRIAVAEEALNSFTGGSYRLKDLVIGDILEFDVSMNNNRQPVCQQIIIKRRPGGRIPPMPQEPFPELDGTHIRNQAEQDWEEKGIPIPKRFLDPDGRAPWTNPPYPLPAGWRPVAPMPREAKR